MISYRSKLVGVFGFPVDENPSVLMNESAFRDKSIDWRYITMLVKPQELKEAFLGIKALNFEGVNLTIPHKIEAMKYVDEVSKEANLIGAINIVVRKDNKFYGDNTDGKGFIAGLKENGIEVYNKRMVVLGAGGASRAICVEAALEKCSSIHIINRTIEKAQEIAEIINSKTNCKATFENWDKTIEIPECDILVNATSIGLYPGKNFPDIDYARIAKETFVQDIIPNPSQTIFLKKCKEHGLRTNDGLSMLVHQGAIGIEMWTGEKPNIQIMKQALEKANC